MALHLLTHSARPAWLDIITKIRYSVCWNCTFLEIKIFPFVILYIQELYTWDNGNQLTYPVKFTDIGYNTPEIDLANDRIEVSGPEALVQEEWDTVVEIT